MKKLAKKLVLTVLAASLVIPAIVTPVSAAELTLAERQIPYRYTAQMVDQGLKFSADQQKISSQAFISSTGDLYAYFGQPALPMHVSKGIKFKNVSSYALQGNIKLTAIAENGDVYQGNAANTHTSITLTKVAGLSNAVDVSTGNYNTFIVTSTGEVFTWGNSNTYGQFGDGTKVLPSNNMEPRKIAGLSDIVRISTSFSSQTTAAVTSTGEVFTWGTSSALGLGAVTTVSVPTKVAELSNIEYVTFGGSHALAKTKDGDVWSWGVNANGELGHGDLVTLTVPKKIASLSNVASISGGISFSAAVKADNTFLSWGNGVHGRFLDNNVSNHNLTTPTALVLPIGVEPSVVFANFEAIFVVDKQADVYAWGGYNYGSLADGVYTTSVTAQRTPYKLAKMFVDTTATVNFKSLDSKAIEIKVEPVVGATNYKISRNGTVISNSTSNSAVDTNLYAGVDYTYDIEVTQSLGAEYGATTSKTLTKKIVYTHTGGGSTSTPTEPNTPSAPVEEGPKDTDTEAFRDSEFGIKSGGLFMFVKTTNLNKNLHLEQLREAGYKEDISTVDELKVTDYSGTDDGWSVYVTATPVTEVTPEFGFAEGTEAIVLPEGVVSLESTITTVPEFGINLDLQGIDSSVPQKFMWSTEVTPSSENALPEDSTSTVRLGNLEAIETAVDPINYPDQSTPFQTTVKFTLVQGEL